MHKIYSSCVISSAACFGTPHMPFDNYRDPLMMACVVCQNMEN